MIVEQTFALLVFDTIWAVTFGTEEVNATKAQIEHLGRNKASLKLPVGTDEPVFLPKSPIPVAFNADLKLTDSLDPPHSETVHAIIVRHIPFIARPTPSKTR